MYSRFTPMPDGSYQRRQVGAQKPASPAKQLTTPAEAKPSQPQNDLRTRLRQLLPQEMELGDVLVLLVALLLLVDAEEDYQTVLITLAAFFLL